MAIPRSGDLRLCTTIALPTIKGPLTLAKTLISLDALAGGRLIAGLGPGSSSRDYTAVGLPFEERWGRFEEAVEVMRGLFRGEDPPDGLHYATSSVTAELQPRPGAPIPIWIGSWGSEAGLRRVARLADGWLASGYNTTPEEFGSARERLEEELERQGRSAGLPNALATMWTWITEDRSEAERILADVLGPAVKRDPDYLRPGLRGLGRALPRSALPLRRRRPRAGVPLAAGRGAKAARTRRGGADAGPRLGRGFLGGATPHRRPPAAPAQRRATPREAQGALRIAGGELDQRRRHCDSARVPEQNWYQSRYHASQLKAKAARLCLCRTPRSSESQIGLWASVKRNNVGGDCRLAQC